MNKKSIYKVISKNIKKSLAYFCMSSLIAFSSNSINASTIVNNDCSRCYVRAEVGESFSRCADITANSSYWDASPQGYNNDLGRVPLFGIGVGGHLLPWFSVGLSGTFRNNFEYCKFQRPTSENPVTPFASGAKTRRFSFDNSSFMADFYFNRAGNLSAWQWSMCSVGFAPYFGVSVGQSKNTVYNFHSVNEDIVQINDYSNNIVSAIMTSYSTKDVGWSVQAGIDVFSDSCLDFSLGYRYFDGGCLRSNNYTFGLIAPETPHENLTGNILKAPAWCGKFTTNELVASLNVYF